MRYCGLRQINVTNVTQVTGKRMRRRKPPFLGQSFILLTPAQGLIRILILIPNFQRLMLEYDKAKNDKS